MPPSLSIQRMGWYIFIFLLAFAGIALWNTWMVTHPQEIASHRTPDQLNLPHEEVTLTTSDDITLSGWFIPHATEQERALVLLHGYPAEKGDMLFLARDLHPDFNMLVIDMRSFGDSGGTHTTLGTKEVRDLEAAVDFLQQRGFERIGVLGFSLGGAVALLHTPDDPRIDAVASYASFAHVGQLGVDTMALPGILARPLVYLMGVFGEILYGIDVGNAPVKAAGEISVPVLLIHSREDDQIPFSHGQSIQQALPEHEQTEFLFLPEGRHGEIPPYVIERIRGFFTETL